MVTPHKLEIERQEQQHLGHSLAAVLLASNLGWALAACPTSRQTRGALSIVATDWNNRFAPAEQTASRYVPRCRSASSAKSQRAHRTENSEACPAGCHDIVESIPGDFK